MYVDKGILVQRIKSAALAYKNELVGRTFLIVYDKKAIEIIFKTDSFLHLTGVATTLSAQNFYGKAVKGRLRETEIYFDAMHPADFANLKTQHLMDLTTILRTDTLIGEGIRAATASFPIGVTDLKMVICFGQNIDSTGKKVNDCLIPYSLRIESMKNDKINSLYEVDYVFSKQTSKSKYSVIEFGEKSGINLLPEEIKEKLDSALI